jgi:hypothetical protein
MRRTLLLCTLLLVAVLLALPSGGAQEGTTKIFVITTTVGVKCNPNMKALWIVKSGGSAGVYRCSAVDTLTVVGNSGTVTGTGTAGRLAQWSSSTGIEASNVTLTGPTAARTVTLPDANFTAARTDAGQTFVGNQLFGTGSAITPVLQLGATNTGIYGASNSVGLAGGGSNLALFAAGSSGVVTLGIWTSAGTYTMNAAGGGAGNPNRQGVNLTIGGGQSTGNGAAGEIIFQTTPAGSSGSAANAYSEALRVTQNVAGQTRVCFAGTQVCDIIGSGSPEGVVSAAVGSTFRRADGGASTSLYVKESGSGNTGWVGK